MIDSLISYPRGSYNLKLICEISDSNIKSKWKLLEGLGLPEKEAGWPQDLEAFMRNAGGELLEPQCKQGFPQPSSQLSASFLGRSGESW